jgi:hypothetical protein
LVYGDGSRDDKEHRMAVFNMMAGRKPLSRPLMTARTIRCPESLMTAARQEAEDRGETVAAAIRRFIDFYNTLSDGPGRPPFPATREQMKPWGIRTYDKPWAAALVKADARQEVLAEELRRYLTNYARKHLHANGA